MTFLQAIILSFIEGVTEFLPISSTGHLILAAKLLGISQTSFVTSFEIFIQLGAILAIVALYSKPLFKDKEVLKRLFIAFLPTMIVGVTLYKVIKTYLLGNTFITLFALFAGGILLIILELYYKKKKQHTDQITTMTYKQALIIGACQSLAVVPGVSRAAATIMSGMGLGLSRKTAVEFSFLLAVPTMLAATSLDLFKSSANFSQNEYGLLIVGFLGSFIFAFFSVKWFASWVKTSTLIPFGIYRIILAVVYFFITL